MQDTFCHSASHTHCDVGLCGALKNIKTLLLSRGMFKTYKVDLQSLVPH